MAEGDNRVDVGGKISLKMVWQNVGSALGLIPETGRTLKLHVYILDDIWKSTRS